MFKHEYTDSGSIFRVTVTRDLAGWELREERDSTIVRHAHYQDWHRVERALRTIELAHQSIVNSR